MMKNNADGSGQVIFGEQGKPDQPQERSNVDYYRLDILYGEELEKQFNMQVSFFFRLGNDSHIWSLVPPMNASLVPPGNASLVPPSIVWTILSWHVSCWCGVWLTIGSRTLALPPSPLCSPCSHPCSLYALPPPPLCSPLFPPLFPLRPPPSPPLFPLFPPLFPLCPPLSPLCSPCSHPCSLYTLPSPPFVPPVPTPVPFTPSPLPPFVPPAPTPCSLCALPPSPLCSPCSQPLFPLRPPPSPPVFPVLPPLFPGGKSESILGGASESEGRKWEWGRKWVDLRGRKWEPSPHILSYMSRRLLLAGENRCVLCA